MIGEMLIPVVIFAMLLHPMKAMISFLHSSGEMLPSDEDNEVAAVSETCNGFAVHALPQWMSAKGIIASPKS